MGMNDKQQLTIAGVSKESAEAGLMEGDVPLKVMGTKVSMETVRQVFGKIQSMKAGALVDMIVQRGSEEVEVSVPLQQRMDRHIFEEMANPTEEQLKLREAWSKNL